jgi:hypothetical protein
MFVVGGELTDAEPRASQARLRAEPSPRAPHAGFPRIRARRAGPGVRGIAIKKPE